MADELHNITPVMLCANGPSTQFERVKCGRSMTTTGWFGIRVGNRLKRS
jgi:hypothetical protein